MPNRSKFCCSSFDPSFALPMDNPIFLPSPRKSRFHALALHLMGFIALALIVLFCAVARNCEKGPIGINSPHFLVDFRSHVSQSKSLLIPGPQLESRRKLQAHERAGNSLQLRLLHRNALESPVRKEFASREEEIIEIVAFDDTRIKGFHASLASAKHRMSAFLTNVDAPSPSPSSVIASPAEFQGKLVSGASLPGNLGQYFVEFYVGTPGQRFLFIADTGSDLVWVPCSLCKKCDRNANSGAVFSAEESSTFLPISCTSQECEMVPPPASGATCNIQSPTSCTYEYVYSDQSDTIGVFAYDTVTMSSSSGSNVEIKNVAFGCGINNTGPSVTTVGGVIGLGQGPISFPTQVGYMFGSKFSYCFRSFFRLRSSSMLVFGNDLVGTKLRHPLQYTPLLQNPSSETFYYVQIEALRVGGKVLSIPASVWAIDSQGNGGAVIDSGTTLTFFSEPAYSMILAAFKSEIRYRVAPSTAQLDLCYNLSGIQNPKFPKLSILFRGNAVFRPPTNNYILNPVNDIWCLGILGSSPRLGISVLGNLLQQNFYIEYDRLNNRLGFAKAYCSAAQ